MSAEQKLAQAGVFKGMAMQGICANPEHSGSYENYAHDAVKYADALLAELEKQQ